MDEAMRRRLLIECLAQMAMHLLEQKRSDASAEVAGPGTDASDGQSATDQYSYHSTVGNQTQAGGAI
jgi:hypothetical protein